jgi:cyclophilin family peptidyl-prolyl cis-trans isomerase
VDATLSKYEGQEEELFRKLQAKYAEGKSFPLPSGEGPICYLEFSVDTIVVGRVAVKLFEDTTPLASKNFKCLCTGEKGMGRLGKPLCYKGSKVHRIVPSFCVQMGDFTRGNGTGGESIYPPNSEHGDAWGKFKDEVFFQHSKAGLLSMANSGKNTNSSQVFFTLRPVPQLNGKHVVFGEVVDGMHVIESLGKLETDEKQNPVQQVVVSGCGIVIDGKDVPCQTKENNPFASSSTMTFGDKSRSSASTSSSEGGIFSFGNASSRTQSKNTPAPLFAFGAQSNGTNPCSFSFGNSNETPSFESLSSSKSDNQQTTFPN